MTDFEQYDAAMQAEADYAKKMAIATLNDAVNQIYNIPGDRFQMAYDVLEAVLSNLKIEEPK
jgi:hypothetical protein